MKAIVVGAGIGGLSVALFLRRAGLEVAVFEKAAELGEVGAGISLWANAVRALREIGVYGPIRESGAEIGGEVRTWRGRLLSRIPAEDLKHRFGDANIAVHRADLQAALLAALPDGTVRLGVGFSGFEQDEVGVVAQLDDGLEEKGDLLVGADGLRSTVRARLLGDGPPRYAGFTAWRGIAHAPGLLPDGVGINLLGRGSELGLVGMGRGRYYWYLTKNAPEGEVEGPSGRKAEVLEMTRGAYAPARAAVEATDEAAISRHDVYHREPLGESWGEGRITLLGDAAHPMTPGMGQGVCQALEDAGALAGSLAASTGGEGRDVAGALRLYEQRRAARAAKVVRGSRQASRVAQMENPLSCVLRDAAVKVLPSAAQLRRLDDIVGHEPGARA